MDQPQTTILIFYGGLTAVGVLIALIGIWVAEKYDI